VSPPGDELPTVIITDHGFPSIELQQNVIDTADFTLEEIKPNCKTENEVIQKCAKADVLLVQWAPITRRVLEALPRVRGVVRYGVGVDNIDVQAARELGRVVSNVPHYCQDEVSDHAIAMILSLARRIPHDHNQLREGKWGITPFLPIPAFSDLTLGFVAFGSIARKVSEKAKLFRFRQIAFDPIVSADTFTKYGVESVDRDTLMRTSDIISLHCPLLPETRQLINADSIARMKPGALLVNTARGALVNEVDLVTALKTGKLSGAGLDVFEKEPLPTDSPLRGLPNVLLTSHSASVSTRAREFLQIQAAEAARDILLGKRPAGALN
jgi:D-3-phosphoglycerate dehydrogenase / 2-oxoglutarate reductase